MTKFEPIYNPTSNDDERLDVHADPPGRWARIVVVGCWQNAKITRKRWPHAAVVGPLRTTAGIDLLVRNLLANPQVRLVIVDGPTAGVVGDMTVQALAMLWNPAFGPQPHDLYAVLGEDLTVTGPPETNTYDRTVDAINTIRLHFAKFQDGTDGFQGADIERWISAFVPDEDRAGPALRLPPPPPKANAPAPHGDPGERVVGDTLAEVWPLTLHRIMRFGREVPTQYGMTRECWNLVSVIRDPAMSLRELGHAPWTGGSHLGHPGMGEAFCGEPLYTSEGAPRTDIKSYDTVSFDPADAAGTWCPGCIKTALDEPHPVLALTYAQVERYYREELTGPLAPEGQTYGYGSRMRGAGGWRMDAGVERILFNGSTGDPEVLHGGLNLSFSDFTEGHEDQIEAVAKLLTEKPDTRAAYLTPWRADEDAGKESGRPCLVGVMFRAHSPSPLDRAMMAVLTAGANSIRQGYEDMGAGPIDPVDFPAKSTLHMTVWFRSHDYGSAYPQNIAGCCLWLVELAGRLGMTVGTLTCMSGSAHVYDKGWAKAEKVIEGIRWPAIRWDSRSSWRVEKVDGPDDIETRCQAKTDEDHTTMPIFGCPNNATAFWRAKNCSSPFPFCDGHAEEKGPHWSQHPLPKKPLLRATAFSPGPTSDGKIIAVLEGGTPNELRLKLERSGLVTEIGSAMWVSGEIERVWGTS